MAGAEFGTNGGPASESSHETYDVLVIGGGVNGLATAWDAAARGMSVLIVDKGDWGSGTSSWSSRLVHGGLKYLEHLEFGLVYESLRDREWLLRKAPHLVKPLPFLMPFYKTNQHNRWVLRLGMLIYDVLSFGKSVPNHRALSPKQTVALAPGLRQDGLQGAGRYYDAQVEFAERLCIELLLAAQAAGAVTRNHTAAVSFVSEGARVSGAVLFDGATRRERTVHARVVINAAGPWIDDVLAGTPMGAERLNGGTKGTHLVVRRFVGGPSTDCVYYEAQSDGRQVLVIPWHGRYLIGSTDKRFIGDLDRAQPDQQEVDYILSETNIAFPGAKLSADDVEYAYTGVRPLPYVPTGDVGKITRKHIIHAHGPNHPGLLTVIGASSPPSAPSASMPPTVRRSCSVCAQGRAPARPPSPARAVTSRPPRLGYRRCCRRWTRRRSRASSPSMGRARSTWRNSPSRPATPRNSVQPRRCVLRSCSAYASSRPYTCRTCSRDARCSGWKPISALGCSTTSSD